MKNFEIFEAGLKNIAGGDFDHFTAMFYCGYQVGPHRIGTAGADKITIAYNGNGEPKAHSPRAREVLNECLGTLERAREVGENFSFWNFQEEKLITTPVRVVEALTEALVKARGDELVEFVYHLSEALSLGLVYWTRGGCSRMYDCKKLTLKGQQVIDAWHRYKAT